MKNLVYIFVFCFSVLFLGSCEKEDFSSLRQDKIDCSENHTDESRISADEKKGGNEGGGIIDPNKEGEDEEEEEGGIIDPNKEGDDEEGEEESEQIQERQN